MPLVKPIQRAYRGAIKFIHKRWANRPAEQLVLNTDKITKVLIVGETGSGKSTFINYLTNYFRDGSLENLRISIPSQYYPEPTEEFQWNERNVTDNGQSQTDDCHQYIFVHPATNKQYLFIDTPGLGDTRGSDQDSLNIDKIINAVEALGDLTAVIIVVNGTVCREHLVLRNVVARLTGHLPNAVMKQVIVVLTNAKRHEVTFDLKLLHLRSTIYPYYMQNAAFCSDPNDWDESTIEMLQADWNQSMVEIEALINTMDSFKANSVKAFIEMKDIRNQIKTLMHSARLQITEIQRMQDEISMFEEGLKQANEGTVAFSNYSTCRIVDKVEIVDAPYHSTLCQNCNHVCHDRCQLDETTLHGAQLFKRCSAMDTSGSCKECRHKCPYTAHYHAKATVKTTQSTLNDVIADIKAKYDKASNDKNFYEEKIQTTSQAKNLFEQALQQKNNEIRQYCIELRRICSGFNLANELAAFLEQLRVEASLLRNTTDREKANEFIRSLKLFCDSIGSDLQANESSSSEMIVMNTQRFHRAQVDPISNDIPAVSPPKSEKETHVDQSVMNLIKQLNSLSNNNTTPTEQKTTTNTIDLHPTEKAPKSTDSPSVPLKADDLIRLTNKQLVTQYEDKKTDLQTSKLILAELTRRSRGASTGPIFAASDIFIFTKYTQKYNELDVDKLTIILFRLQNQVNDTIESNIARLADVNSELLLEMCAVHNTLSERKKQPATLSDISDNGHQAFHSSPTGTSTNSNGNMPRTDPNPPNYDDVTKPKISRIPRPGNGNFAKTTRNQQPHNNTHRHTKRSFPSFPSSIESKSDIDQSDDNDESSTTSDSNVSIISHASVTLASGITLPTDISHGNSDEIRSTSDKHLLDKYETAETSRNRSVQHAIYNELERRCYGDHPLLIEQQQSLFDKILDLHRPESMEKLTKTRQIVRDKIETTLSKDGALGIRALPPAWIIEAAVIDKLLTEKSQTVT